jgi:hypothetical protein
LTSSGGTTQASSGASSAQGLTAQNTVNTNASVSVKVAGQNFAPIQVIVNSITQIFNWGVGSATSGDATAAGSGKPASGSGGQVAASGSAQATGAQVQNTVDLRSSASVTVLGDNYNPINIVMNLAANLVNWGAGLANSGDAKASGSGGGGTASSGSATANGLLVLNLVSMWADASVDIEGNNYAPITINITFNTNIDNRGYAGASSGNVAAGSTAAGGGSASAPVPSGTTSSSSNSGTTSRSRSGDALAISNSSNTAIVSSQISSANGSRAIDSTVVGTMLRNLPTGNWSPFVNQAADPGAAPVLIAGADSRSGDSTAIGLRSSVNQTNSQIAACSDPGVSCVATNSETHFVTVKDSPNNAATVDDSGKPGPPGTHSTTAFSGVNVTPTPTPSARSSASNGGADSSSSSSSSSSFSFSSQSSVGPRHTRVVFGSRTFEMPPDGHTVVVDLWDQWPGRRLPPMPNMVRNSPTTHTVTASLGGWPGADELPLPDPQAQPAADDVIPPPRRGTATTTVSRPGMRSGDVAAEADTDEYPPLDVRVFDLYGWPDALAMPLPQQRIPAPVIAADQTSTTVDSTVADSSSPPPPDAGTTPIAMVLGLIGAIAVGAAFTVWRAHILSARLRGLAFLKLVLGVIRIW